MIQEIICFIALSENNCIADKEGGVSWLEPFSNIIDDNGLIMDCGYHDFLDSIDTIVMGSKSYEQTITFGPWAWQDKKTYAISSRPLTAIDQSITIWHPSINDLVKELNQSNENHMIWLFGGAELIHSFDKANLIDTLQFTIIPVHLKDGIPLQINYDIAKI
jgi:dihydrofolate reductase